ncbi:MAG: sulfurtransferase [Bacteroidota bacterium]|nr:sulfurtransferase [Bacteroidota bacterium]
MYPLISVLHTLEIYNQPNIICIDCRNYLDDDYKGRGEFLKSHIPGAVHFDLKHDLSGPIVQGVSGRHPLPDPVVLNYSLRSAGINPDTHVIAYDHANGSNAARLWWLLRWLGHENVQVLDGGLAAWLNQQGAIDNEWILPEKGTFEGTPKADMVVEMKEVKNHSDVLVDSREMRRYKGEHEPIDFVAGHIPGAICIPYMDSVTPSGIWKDQMELACRFQDLPEAPVFYCGSGVTACHNILAYKIATGKDALLYPGGWSEWIRHHKVTKQN